MAVNMFLKLGDIVGESLQARHEGEIDVLAWSWGASNAGSLQIRSGGAAGRANFQDLSITKYIDRSSEDLLGLVATGRSVPEAVLTVERSGESEMPYLVLTCRPVLVTSFSTGGSGGEDRLTENITLNLGSFEYAYTYVDGSGEAGRPERFGWDIAKNAAL